MWQCSSDGRSNVRRDDVGAQHVPAHVGDLFGTLVDEQHDDVALGVVALDRVHDLLDDRRLARLRRRHDHAALALADRRDEIDDAAGDLARVVGELEPQPRVGEQRREVFEARRGARASSMRDVVDEVDAHERRVLLAARRRAGRALDVVALAQTEAAHLRRGDVRVVAAGEVSRRAQEAVALVAQVEQTFDLDQLAAVLVAAVGRPSRSGRPSPPTRPLAGPRSRSRPRRRRRRLFADPSSSRHCC